MFGEVEGMLTGDRSDAAIWKPRGEKEVLIGGVGARAEHHEAEGVAEVGNRKSGLRRAGVVAGK